MFAHIARGYDRFDHIASLGNDYLWRPRALWDLDRFRGGRPPARILDVGCGTGDLSILSATHYRDANVVGVDATAAMIAKAHGRAVPKSARRRLAWSVATALRLPFPSGEFDLVLSAFLVRNLADLRGAMAEFRRVLAPGGTLLTLEITEPESPWFRRLFHSYFDTFIPWLGRAAGSEGPYRYLPESLRRLPGRSAMLSLLRSSGFRRVEVRPQSLGIVSSYLGEADGEPPANGVMEAGGTQGSRDS